MPRLARKTLVALAVLLGFGLAKAPLEDRLAARLVAQGLLAADPGSGLGDLVGRTTVLAVLGGLRPLVAIYTTLHAFDAWSYRDWDTVERDYRLITTLVPEDIDSWMTGSWHLAYNAAASHAFDDSGLPEATRRQLSLEWVVKGIEFLKRGVERHPRSSALHKALADTYRQQLQDDCLAARHYQLAAEGDAPQAFVRRFHAYFLARCPGHEEEAYQLLMALYEEGPSQRLPTLIQRIKELEGKLDVPASRRIPDPDPDLLIRRRHPEARLP